MSPFYYANKLWGDNMNEEMREQEIWKDIKFFDNKNNVEWDFTGLYQVSSLGRVKSLKRDKEHILKPFDRTGYQCVRLNEGTFYVHRLVAFMFVQNDDLAEKICVNHIDENKANNCADNLEWCTYKYNSNYGERNNIISQKMKDKYSSGEYKRCQGYLATNAATGETLYFKRMRDAKRAGFDSTMIYNCCSGRSKTYMGCTWEKIFD